MVRAQKHHGASTAGRCREPIQADFAFRRHRAVCAGGQQRGRGAVPGDDDPLCRRPRDHAPGQAGSDPHRADLRHSLRPIDRGRLCAPGPGGLGRERDHRLGLQLPACGRSGRHRRRGPLQPHDRHGAQGRGDGRALHARAHRPGQRPVCHQPRTPSDHLPLHRGTAGGRGGHYPGCRPRPCPAGRRVRQLPRLGQPGRDARCLSRQPGCDSHGRRGRPHGTHHPRPQPHNRSRVEGACRVPHLLGGLSFPGAGLLQSRSPGFSRLP